MVFGEFPIANASTALRDFEIAWWCQKGRIRVQWSARKKQDQHGVHDGPLVQDKPRVE